MVHLLIQDDSQQWNELTISASNTFDYAIENNLFTEGESYSMDIDLPFEDNINSILRDDRIEWKGKLILDSIVKKGVVYITEKTKNNVKVQFVEKRLSDIFDEVYINTMELPRYLTATDWHLVTGPDGFTCVQLPWYNDTTEEYVNRGTGESFGHQTAMPFLIKLVREIVESEDIIPEGEVPYRLDVSEWNNTDFRYLICCNVLPLSWGRSTADALPNWTIREFLTQLGHLLHGLFIIDDDQHLVTFRFYGSLQHSSLIKVDVFDDYSMSVEEASDCKYDRAKNVKYADTEGVAASYYSCPDVLKNLLVKYGKPVQFDVEQDQRTYITPYIAHSAQESHKLLYCEWLNTYFITLYNERELQPTDPAIYDRRVKALNLFGPVRRNSSDEFDEIKIVPVPIDYEIIHLAPKQNEDAVDSETNIHYPAIENAFNNSVKSDGKVEYYDKMYVGYWFMDPGAEGYHRDQSVNTGSETTSVPAVSRIYVHWGERYIKVFDKHYDLGLAENGNVSGINKAEDINPECLYKFSFLSRDIPNASSIFVIRGEKYVCKQLKTVFNATTGMSERIEGEFYKVIN